ncbi:MAG: hypothetical protein LAO30_11405 [Acidobacteriia bacterium]|nr:hypothetical protein [Terriglobia bacterium]
MKKTLFVLCLLSTTAAFGQYYSGAGHLDSQPVIYEPPSHPAHATYAPMSQERSVLTSTSYSSAQGERRASDFPQVDGISLGMYAREMRKQHSQAKKARVVWVNQ